MGYRDDYDDDYDYKDSGDDDESSDESPRSSGFVRNQVTPFNRGGTGGAGSGTSNLPGRSSYEGPGAGRSPQSPISRDDVSRRDSGSSGSSNWAQRTSSGGGGSSSSGGGGGSSSGGSGWGQRTSGGGGSSSGGGGGGGGGGSSSSGGGNWSQQRSPVSPSGGGGGGGNRPPQDNKKDDKKDATKDDPKKEGGGFGGFLSKATGQVSALTGRFSGGKDDGDGKKDKPAQPKKDTGGGGFMAKATSTMSSLTASLPIGKKDGDVPKKDKPAQPKGDKGDAGGIGGMFGKVTGSVSGLFNRGGDEKPAKKDDKPAPTGGYGGGARPGTGGIGGGAGGGSRPGTSPFSNSGSRPGTGPIGGAKPEQAKPAEPAGRVGGLFGVRGRSGDAGGDKPAQPKSALTTRSGIFGWFGGGDDKRKSKTLSASGKSVKVENEGMSLDTKLDILGVSLVFGALMLFFSAISADQGAITGQINSFTSRVFGWGSIAVPVTMMAVGVWLIVRHFGDTAPVIHVQRLVGLGMGYAGLLVAFHYMESFNPIYDGNLDFFRFYGHLSGRGGGMIGTELYIIIQQTIGEIGGVFVLLGWFVVSVMLITGTSAAELGVIVISLWRSYQIARKHRAQKRAAQRLLEAQNKPEPIAVARGAGELTAGAQGALPAPLVGTEQLTLPIEERPIPIRMGGQMVTSEQHTAPPPPVTLPTGGTPAPAQPAGRFGRLLNALPIGGGEKEESPARPAEPRTEGGLLSGLLRRGDKPAAPPPADSPKPDGQGAGGIAGAVGMAGAALAVGAVASLVNRDGNTDDSSKPAPVTSQGTGAGVSPFTQRTSTGSAPFASPVEPAKTPDDDALTPDDLRPAQPRGIFTQGAGAPASTGTPPASASPFQRPAPVADSTPDQNAEQPAETQGQPAAGAEASPVAERLSRLDQLRQGMVRPPTATPAPEPARTESETEPVQPAQVSPPPAPTPAPQRAEPTVNTPPPASPVPTPTAPAARQRKTWVQPDFRTLLASGSEQDFDREALVKRARIIEDTLQSFGAPGRVVEINTGPVITQFGVEPDYLMARGGKKSRVKVSTIAQLDKDLQLALNAKSIRIEAPVPGKGFVGVEVPNDEAATVSLRDVMEAREFKRIKSPLAIALGQSVDGAPVAGDLASMPHLLIAGTTGSGKSVCVNAIIASLILNNSPDVVKFIMVDPKRVELTGYNGIPHLVAPVVVELERVVGVLKWVTREMDERYKKFSNAGARNIVDYNNHLAPGAEIMPYIVVIIDELADLMMLAPDETERTITRIAALARATGIHLVLATQRPSVDVVTGLIKANFPARVAFAVASGIDSRVILDQPGAEKLLGRGDMLYMSGDSPAPLRLQGVYVSDGEINNVTRFWRSQQSDAPRPLMTLTEDQPLPLRDPSPAPGIGNRPTTSAYQQPILWDADDDDDYDDDDSLSSGAYGEEDELYEESVELVRRLNKASVSLLQRRLRIGYTRAARLIDVMEERGVVGPATEGSKPRMVLPPK